MVRKLFCGFNLAKWEWKLIRIGVCVSLTFTHSSQCWENMRYLPTSHLHEEHERRCKLALPSSLNLVAFLWPPLPGWHEEVAPSDSWTTSSFFFFGPLLEHTQWERKGGAWLSQPDQPRDRGLTVLKPHCLDILKVGLKSDPLKILQGSQGQSHYLERMLYAMISFPKPASLSSSNYWASTCGQCSGSARQVDMVLVFLLLMGLTVCVC